MMEVEYKIEPDGEWIKGLSVEGYNNSIIVADCGKVVANREDGVRVFDVRYCPSNFCMTIKGENDDEYNNW